MCMRQPQLRCARLVFPLLHHRPLSTARPASPRCPGLQARLEVGRAERALAELEARSFSNEDQMLAQAAIWQQQAAEAAVAERAAAPQHWQLQEAEGSAMHTSGGSGGSVEAWPLDELLDAAEEASIRQRLEERHGLAEGEAAAVVDQLVQRCPAALSDWGRAEKALAWLQQQPQLAPGLTLRRVAERAPLLLAQEEARLHTCLRIAAAHMADLEGSGAGGEPQNGAASSSSGSVIASMCALFGSQAGSQAGAAAEPQPEPQAAQLQL